MSKEIIGITGPLGSGKSTASEILQSRGYKPLSFSDEIKKEAAIKGLPIDNRSVLQDIGDKLRREHGLDVLARRIVETFLESGEEKCVIDGIRNPGESKYIQEAGGFVIGINAPVEIRFERTLARGNPYYPQTREEFEIAEKRYRGVGQKSYGQQADECLKLSDVVIENNGTLEDFKEKFSRCYWPKLNPQFRSTRLQNYLEIDTKVLKE